MGAIYDFNKVFISGNLTHNPEYQLIGEKQTPVCNLKIANNQGEQSQYFVITCWFKVALAAYKYLKRGDPIFVEGEIKNSFSPKHKRSFFKIEAKYIRYKIGESLPVDDSDPDVVIDKEHNTLTDIMGDDDGL